MVGGRLGPSNRPECTDARRVIADVDNGLPNIPAMAYKIESRPTAEPNLKSYVRGTLTCAI